MEFLRKAVGVETFKESNQQQRNITKHVVNLSEKIGKEEFKERLKGILSDEFKAKNCNSINYLYRELKSYIVAPIVPTESKKTVVFPVSF